VRIYLIARHKIYQIPNKKSTLTELFCVTLNKGKNRYKMSSRKLTFIVVLFWEQHVLVLGGLTAIFFIAGFVLWNALQNALKEKSKLFSASLAELGHDREHLAPAPRYE
jgi:uncharacterized membrane protein YqjE